MVGKLLRIGNNFLDSLPKSKKEKFNGDLATVVTVVGNEYAIVSANSRKTVVNTFGLGPCIGLTLEDIDSGLAAVAHYSTTNVIPSTENLLNDLNNFGGSNYSARLFGGIDLSANMVNDIILALRRFNVSIVEADLFNQSRTRSIGIGVDGTLYSNTFFDVGLSFGQRIEESTRRDYLLCHYKP